jgi:hypothetical protein
MTDTETEIESDAGLYDKKALEREASQGAKAYGELHKHAGDDWNRWEAAIIGLAALRDMAFAATGTRNMRSQNYREAIGALMQRSKYMQYSMMSRTERSACYKLADHIHEVSAWYNALASAEKLAWKHPETLIKHVPPQFLAADPHHNEPKPNKPKKKKALSAEARALAALIMELIHRLAKYEPDALDMLPRVQQLLGEGVPDPDDSLEGAFGEAEDETAD